MGLRIVLISGAVSDAPCGVADYTLQLGRALERLGLWVELYHARRWGLGSTWEHLRAIRALRPHIVHIQYPAVAYGKGLAPQLLAMLMPHRVVVTLHELSQAHPARKVAMLPLLFAASYVIFTSEYEREYCLSRLPVLGRRSRVIPIGSNVPYVDNKEPKNPRLVCYFGLIRPKKDIDDFLTLARLARERAIALEFVLVGRPVAGYEEYAASLLLEARRLGIRCYSNLNLSGVAEVLSSATFAYLPFRDGASERRGSLLAALGNGLVVLTTEGKATTPALRNVVIPAENPQVALKRIEELVGDEERRTAISRLAKDYAHRFNWSQIATDHLRLYMQLVVNEIRTGHFRDSCNGRHDRLMSC